MLNLTVPPSDVAPTTTSSSFSDVVEGVLDVVARMLNTRLTAVSRIESTTYTVMSVVDQHHTLRPGQIFDLDDTFCTYMLETGQPLRIDDTRQAPMPLRTVPHALEINVRSYVGVPLYMADRRVFGSLWAADSGPRHFTDEDVALLQLFATLLVHEIDQDVRQRQHERIAQAQSTSTSIDARTGLMDRAGFESALMREEARHQRYGNVYALATLRLVSRENSEGHDGQQTADTLRQALADILMRTSRIVDYCAQTEADQFTVLFAETTTSGVQAWQERIVAAVTAWNYIQTSSGLMLNVAIGFMDRLGATVDHPMALLELAQQRECMVFTSSIGDKPAN